ncbi:unnamed protein product, partial [marine sediment metagenome]
MKKMEKKPNPKKSGIQTREGFRGIEWHPLSSGNYRFTQEDADEFYSSTQKNAVWGTEVTDPFRRWLRGNFDRKKPVITPRSKSGGRNKSSCGKYHFTAKDVVEFRKATPNTNAFVRVQKVNLHPTDEFKEWLVDESSGKHEVVKVDKPERTTVSSEYQYSTISNYDTEPFITEMNRYGVVHLPHQIREDVEDIMGEESKKENLEAFFLAFKEFRAYAEALKHVNLLPSFTYLLYGASGTGKTTLARAYAKRFGIPIVIIESSKMVS